MTSKLLPDTAQRRKGNFRGRGVGADRHGKRVKNNILFCDAVLGSRVQNLLCNLHPALGGIRDPVLIKGQRHDHTAVLAGQGKYRLHAVPLPVYRIDHRLAVVAAQRYLHGRRVGRVDLQRQIHDRLQCTHAVPQHCGLIDIGKSHIDVQNVRTLLLLPDTL